MPSLHTAPETVTAVTDFATGVLGKTVVHSRDRAGFVVNSPLTPYPLAAIRMAESGFVTAADIDTGTVLGCAHPMGPLRLADLIGPDTVASIAESLYEEFKAPPTPLPRCSSGWWKPGCGAARPAGGATHTAGTERPGSRTEGSGHPAGGGAGGGSPGGRETTMRRFPPSARRTPAGRVCDLTVHMTDAALRIP